MLGEISKYLEYILRLSQPEGKNNNNNNNGGGGRVTKSGNVQIQIEGQPSILPAVRGDPDDTSQ